MVELQFQTYRKTVPTVARVLSQEDYEARGGIIQTNEGPKEFSIGDYLGMDAKGEWPIPALKIRENYTRITDIGTDGFAQYQALDTREAAQVSGAFEVEGLTGKAGDYLVKSGESQCPVDREQFEATYSLAE